MIKQIRLKFVVLGCIVLFGLLFLFILFSNRLVIKSAEGKLFNSVEAIPKNKVGLVLGASKCLFGKHLNPYFVYRLEAAIQLYKSGKIEHIVVSGDNSIANYNEPEDMKNYLIENGIPDAAITCDYAGFRTFDSMIRAKKIFGLHQFTIISQRFHNERALFIAQAFKLDVVAFNAKNPYIGPRSQLREVLAKSKAVIDMYIFPANPKFLGKQEKILF